MTLVEGVSKQVAILEKGTLHLCGSAMSCAFCDQINSYEVLRVRGKARCHDVEGVAHHVNQRHVQSDVALEFDELQDVELLPRVAAAVFVADHPQPTLVPRARHKFIKSQESTKHANSDGSFSAVSQQMSEKTSRLQNWSSSAHSIRYGNES